MTTYIIERENDGTWSLRRFGVHQPMGTGDSLEEVREQAFKRLRGFAPCRIRVLGSELGLDEEWRLERADGKWKPLELEAQNETEES